MRKIIENILKIQRIFLQIPFSLCLRVWDIFLLEGEPVLSAMVFTILKLHSDELIKLEEKDDIIYYLQVKHLVDGDFIFNSFYFQNKLCENFGYSDNFVIDKLMSSLNELQRKNMLLPPPANEDEFPKCKLGLSLDLTENNNLESLANCNSVEWNTENNNLNFCSNNENESEEIDAEFQDEEKSSKIKKYFCCCF